MSACKKCSNQTRYKYAQKQKIKNRDKHNKRYREYYKKNRDKVAQQHKIYYQKNATKLKEYTKEYREQHREQRNSQERNRRKTDILHRVRKNYRGRIRQSIKNKAKKNKKTEEMLGCSWAYFIKYMETKFRQGMNWDNYGEWHIDHIIPLSSGKTIEEINILAHYTNCQPLWAIDNLSKGAKIIN